MFVFVLAACSRGVIPNTDVEDTPRNREILEFADKYRVAVEKRDVKTLLNMASKNYYDDNGTPTGDDDMGIEELKQKLKRWRQSLSDVRYEMRYRRVTYDYDRIYVDYTYTGKFRIDTPDGPKWSRRLADNRLTLEPTRDSYRILSGM